MAAAWTDLDIDSHNFLTPATTPNSNVLAQMQVNSKYLMYAVPRATLPTELSDIYYVSLEGNWWENDQQSAVESLHPFKNPLFTSPNDMEFYCHDLTQSKLFFDCSDSANSVAETGGTPITAS